MEFELITRYIKQEASRIRRPANAFMLYANHNRKKMAQLHPLESNKEISKRLGSSWKKLDSAEKLHYYDLAKQVDIEHKRKYPDYVYNPKEARIRKAMREASRERALSVTPMSPRTVRRPSRVAALPNGHGAWNFGNEDQLMMAPASHDMRGGIIASPMCGSSGYPIQAAGNGPFAMQSMHYNKHMHPITHSAAAAAGGSYMQGSSLASIPQQSDLWQPYEDPMRSTPGPYILPPHQMSYPQASSVPPPTIMPSTSSQMEKNKLETENFAHMEDSQSSQTNENIPPNVGDSIDKMPMNEPVFENKVDGIQPLIDNGNMHNSSAEPFMPSYEDNALSQTNGYEKNESIKLKKIPHILFPNNQADLSNFSIPKTFQQRKGDYHQEYIRNYLISNNCHGIEILMNDSGTSQAFNYVTYNTPQVRNYNYPGSIDVNDVLMVENWSIIDDEYEARNTVLNLSNDTKKL